MFKIFYVHSPITYTIAKEVMRRFTEPNKTHLISGRGLSIPKSLKVESEGVWSVTLTISFLLLFKEILLEAPEMVDLYVPHTGFLFGKIIKIATRVRGFFYIEEGKTSTNLAHTAIFNQMIDTAELDRQLSAHGLYQALGLRKSDVASLNRQDHYFYDPSHPKYLGAFAVSAAAFPGYTNKTDVGFHLPKKRKIYFSKTVLVLLPAIYPLVETPNILNLFLEKMVAEVSKNKSLKYIFKLHPRDFIERESETIQRIMALMRDYGELFDDFDFGDVIDKNLEPSFLGFEHYIFYGDTSASDYLKLFWKTNPQVRR